MKVVLQRVSRGSVSVGGVQIAEITRGLVVLLGVGPDDTRNVAQALAKKTAQLRIFPNDQGKMNLSLLDVGGSALVVPQFTLFADTSRGHRPSFTKAAPLRLPDRWPHILHPASRTWVCRLNKVNSELICWWKFSMTDQ